jgi:chromosome segregation ATPase
MTEPRDEIERLKARLENLEESHLGQRVLIASLAAERDEARRDAERWQADALRLLQEKNDALKQRDAARRQCCTEAVQRPFGSGTIHNCGDAVEEATRRGWDCFGPIKP